MSAPQRWLRQQAARRGDAPALVFPGGRALGFAQFDRQVDAAAAAIPSVGNALGCLCTGAEAIITLALAAPRAGMAFFPADPRLQADQVERLFALADVETRLRELPHSPAGNAPKELPPGAVQLIIPTSGSTGAPKGAMLSGANLAAAVAASARNLPLAPGDVWLGCLPLHHIGGLSLVFRCLAAGATARLHQGFDAEAVARDLAEGEASHVSLVPAMLARLLDLEVKPSARLRCALVGGAALSGALAERALAAGWPIRPTYGMSEAGSQVATCSDALGWQPGLAGHPLPGIDVAIGESGRIRVRGPMVMVGYANPALLPGSGLDADGWLETSDLGRFDEEGRLWVLGRGDDVLVSGGENIHPLEVEDLVAHCPGVGTVGITATQDPAWGDRLIAVVTGDVVEEDFLTWCRGNVPSHLRPRAMIKADALPLTSSGKLDRRALRSLVT